MRHTFVSGKYVERVIPSDQGDRTIRFFPVSVGKLFFLKQIATAISSSLATLFGQKSPFVDFKTITRQVGDSSERTSEPPPEALIELRKRHRSEAIRGIVEALLDTQSIVAIGRLLMDSMRDEYPDRQNITDADVKSFVDGLDVEVLPILVSGFIEANRKILGGAEGKVRAVIQAAMNGDLEASSPEPKPAENSPPASGAAESATSPST